MSPMSQEKIYQNGDTVLSVRKGKKQYSNEVILDSIVMDIKQGEFISILGTSGSGKSTLLKLLAGLETWTSGDQINTLKTSSAFVFQDPNLLSWRTVMENTILPLEFQAHQKKNSGSRNVQPFLHSQNTSIKPVINSDHKQLMLREQAHEVLSMVNMTSASERYPHELSGGMKMRTSLARAFITKPQLLFMDEPFAALDEPTRESLQDQLRQIWETQRTTILFVTHSLQEALYLSNRIIFLDGRPAKIVEDRKVELPDHRSSLTRTSKEYFEVLKDLRVFIHSKLN